MSSTMTLDQVRDRIAELEGWTFDGHSWKRPVCAGRKTQTELGHPISETLQDAAKLPAGYWWERDHRRGVWRGGKVGQDYHLPDLVVKDTGNNVEDLTRLRLLCLEHLKGNA